MNKQDIPTTDAQDALRFCRGLASLLEREDTASAVEAAVLAQLPVLSVVVPVYNEEQNIEILRGRLAKALTEPEATYELVFVDDGSDAPCKELLSAMAEKDDHVVVVELSRNFGHQVAVSAGLDHARGDVVVVMDGDLQDPPEVVPDMIRKLREGYDVVYAVRQNRKEGRLKRFAYAAFYRALDRMTAIPVPLDAGDFCVMNRRVVDALRSMPERTRFVRGIRSWVGFRQVGFPYDRDARTAGQPKYGFWRLFFLAVNGVVSLSKTPLRVVTIVGFAISLFSVLMAVFYTVKRILVGLDPPGFATLITAIFLLAGIQLMTIGVVGEYVGRIFDEVKQRPLYIVNRVVGRSGRR